MTIIKRTGEKATYDEMKIYNALYKAFAEVDGTVSAEDENVIKSIVKEITNDFVEEGTTVELLQDELEDKLMESKRKDVARAYVRYRYKRETERKMFMDYKLNVIDKHSEENSNANVDENNFGGKEERISCDILENITDIIIRKKLGEKIFHDTQTCIKIHDKKCFGTGMHNCLLLPYKDMIGKYGINTRQGDTKATKNYNTACHLIPVAIQSQSLDMFGGCGLMNFSIYMVDFLKNSIAKTVNLVSEMAELGLSKYDSLSFSEAREILSEKDYKKFKKYLDKDVENAHQALITNLVTLQSRSGHQLPFSSINLGLIDPNNKEESAYIIEGFLNEIDRGIGKLDKTPVFPIACFQLKGGVNRYPQDEFYYLRMKAQRVSHHRLYPTFVNCDFSHNVVTGWESEMNMMG